jgi:tryptophan synthase beta chain
VLEALGLLAETEGIIAALEPLHAIAYVARAARSGEIPAGSTVLINLSGRGDKDADQVMGHLRLCSTRPCEPVCEGCPNR